MSGLLIFGLVVLWSAALLPDLVRRVSDSRRSDTIGQFSRNLSSLNRAAPVGGTRDNVYRFVPREQQPVVDLRGSTPRVGVEARQNGPQRKSRAQQRRQEVLAALIAAAVLSFLATTAIGGVFIFVQIGVDCLLALYVVAMTSATRRERLRAQAADFYRPTLGTQGVVPLRMEPARYNGMEPARVSGLAR